MKVDVLIEYDEKLSEITFSSIATNFKEKRPSTIGLSYLKNKNNDYELIEFIGENQEGIELIKKEFSQEPTRKDHILRVINPFELSTFEPIAASQMVEFFSRYVLAKFYPKTWEWRRIIPFFISYKLTLKVPGYNFFEPIKKAEFEKLLRQKIQRCIFYFLNKLCLLKFTRQQLSKRT